MQTKKRLLFMFCFILIFTICLSCFAGCGANSATSTVSTDSTSASTAPTDSSGDSITYVKFGDEYLPLSCIRDGKQLLSGDCGYLSDVNKKITGAPSADSVQKFDVKNMYASEEKPQYTHGTATILDTIASNGDWDIFPTQVRYEQYTMENQPDQKEWTSFFKEKLTERSSSDNSPILFSEAWFFTWGTDGQEAVLVNATNIFDADTEQTTSTTGEIPASADTCAYVLSALFTADNEPLLLNDTMVNISTNPISSEKEIFYSYLSADASSETTVEHNYDAVQYDSSGNLTKYPIYASSDFAETGNINMLLCDIDGDGNAELVTVKNVIYGPLIVYSLENGIPTETFRMTLPA